MIKNGIDVSEWQGDIDWKRVKTDFAIIRAGYGRFSSQADDKFSANYTGCTEAKIPCGAYWFSYAKSSDDAKREAEACLDVIKGKRFEYPIFYDVEDSRILALGKTAVSSIIRTFIGTLEAAGYFVGLYMSSDAFTEYTEDDIRRRYALWIADYSRKPDIGTGYGMWQRSSTGKISGISGNVDLDEAYEDYPKIIREAGLNGFTKEETPKHKLSVIIDGKTIIKDYEF